MAPQQEELPLAFPESTGDMPLIPARMVNEYTYCPRLAYLEWVQGEWADSQDTIRGRHEHRRVDRPGGELPPPDQMPEGLNKARSITLSSARLGLVCRMDLVEMDESTVTPVDYKKGKRPHVAKGAYEPERVQLCVQGLILQEHGYRCEYGIIYFAGSRERVRVDFDEALVAATRQAIDGLRLIAAGGQLPPPLEDSPKCIRCSLVGICLPDEVQYFRGVSEAPRPLAVADPSALPLYVQDHRARIGKKGDTLEISIEGQVVQRVRLIDVSQVALFGSAYLTTPALMELMRRQIPVTWHSYGGWFYGHTIGTGHKNVELRLAQYRAHDAPSTCLTVARALVAAKIRNCRTFLRRNWKNKAADREAPSTRLANLMRQAEHARDIPTLLGIEGAAAAAYFGAFRNLLRQEGETGQLEFDFTRRDRRPPPDPINALLSYAYSVLVRSWTVTLMAVGLDPYLGYYHQPRYGRPALALDLMEPFRPLIADSAVIHAVNNGEIKRSDFISTGGNTNLTSDGRRRFLDVIERRFDHQVTHPQMGYRLTYRRLLELQARLFGRFLLGEVPEVPVFTPR